VRWALVVALAACSGGGTKTKGPGEDASARGIAAFATVAKVLQHPRCANCHPAGDIPLQGDEGRPHNQNIQRGPAGNGMVGAECTTCHGKANPPDSYGVHTPPGTSVAWHMPPPAMKMVFVGKSPSELCQQLKDPATNGGKDAAALRAHLDDPLVVWGWAPGRGRTPVSIPRADFLAAFETWIGSAMPCP
jgi:hypothetical protein